MALQRVLAMLQTCTAGSPLFPPTTLYNQTWLLRLLLNWYSAFNLPDHPLTFPNGARWYSDGLLPSAFLSRHTDDRLAEKRMQAAGVIGQFDVGDGDILTGLVLRRDATHLIVLDALLLDPLQSSIWRAPYFDQAARTVACIAETLRRANRYPPDMERIGFYVLAPQPQIDQGVFAEDLHRDSIKQKVKQRVSDYKNSDEYADKKEWYREWFKPTRSQIDLRAISWESLIATVAEHDPAEAAAMDGFYGRCLEFH
ncbi:MAG: hypothetical protein JXQ72_00050 [Anaerolineae bacterium]|nr:hypothetical protein [Anaerolineae bacterium]